MNRQRHKFVNQHRRERMPALRFSPLAVALAMAINTLAHAQILPDRNAPGNQQPTVLSTGNGVPLVNIQTPSSSGVSLNVYRQFDVDPRGAILNNARGPTQTQLGGHVPGNPWLATGTARVIVNQVNSTHPSYLRGGAAFGVTANAAGSRGNSDGRDMANAHTRVKAGGQASLGSGRDANLVGATLEGNKVVAEVGRNLNIASVQDTSSFKSRDQSIGGSVTAGAGFSGSVSASQSKVDADYASVGEQSGIKAGDEGFEVKVNGNTDLKGGQIASTDKAVEEGRNSLSTGTLSAS